jgi:hypothetical protein
MITSLKLVLIGALGAYCFLYGVLASLIRRRDDASRASPVGQSRTNAVEALLFHTDNLFHARVNFFLAVEALLFTALATIWSSGPLPRETVAFFGAVSTVLIFIYKRESRKETGLANECSQGAPGGNGLQSL